MEMKKLVEPLLKWYEENARTLPWRSNPRAYYVWVSEIMLQQTRVEAVKSYYERFLQKYPSPISLADAKEEELLKVWEGLGYYNRVRNMQKAAIAVKEEYDGVMPQKYDLLIKLPGIGPYTAGAIASIAGGERVSAVDGNVLRVITRVCNDDSDISLQSTQNSIREKVEEIIPAEAGKFNQALMDLGATVCLPNGEPKCLDCPWVQMCEAYKQKTYMHLPVKRKAKPRKIEKKTILILQSTKGTALKKRAEKGLLAGMYELPSIDEWIDAKEVLKRVSKLGYHPIHIKEAEEYIHIFSHKEWHMKAFLIRVDEFSDSFKKDDYNAFFFVKKGELFEQFPLPAAFNVYRKYFD